MWCQKKSDSHIASSQTDSLFQLYRRNCYWQSRMKKAHEVMELWQCISIQQSWPQLSVHETLILQLFTCWGSNQGTVSRETSRRLLYFLSSFEVLVSGMKICTSCTTSHTVVKPKHDLLLKEKRHFTLNLPFKVLQDPEPFCRPSPKMVNVSQEERIYFKPYSEFEIR